MYTVGLGIRKGNASGAPNPSNEILIIESDKVKLPGTNAGGIRMVGNIIVDTNSRFEKIYSTKSKTEFPIEGEGDEDAISFKPKAMIQHPGTREELKEFIQYWTGKSIILMHKKCGQDFYEVVGTPCSPLQLKPSRQDNNEASFFTLNFEAFSPTGSLPKNYYGEIELLSPVAVAEADNITTTVDAFNYKLPSVSVEDTVITFNVVGNTVGQGLTLIGGGGTNPATLESGVNGPVTVLLNNDTPWVALKDSTIHFKVFVTGATKYLVEQSRS
jgi:hypothetical protein